MPTIAFPRRHLVSLQELASRVLDSRGAGGETEILARDLLAGFFDVCIRAGLDGVLVELEQAFAPLEVTERSALSDDPRLRSDLIARLGSKSEFDPRGSRTAKPRQLADCLVAVLSLTPSDAPDRTITLSDQLRGEVIAALAGVIDAELRVPQIRETIIAAGRGLCEQRHLKVFERISAQLDERGVRAPPQPKLPLDAVQAAQRALLDARKAVVERAARAAIDRAKPVLARVSAEAAERIDLPITHRLTPRDVAVQRVSDARAAKAPQAVVQSLLESLSELSQLAWLLPQHAARPYAASETFAVGELVDHPKFGRGSVKTVAVQRIEVEFSDGTRALVHARRQVA